MSAAVPEVTAAEDQRPRPLAKRHKVDLHRIERVLEQTPTQVSYVARDLSTQHEVLLVEYLPVDLVTRHEDGSVVAREPGLGAAFALGCRRFTQHATRLTRFDHPSLPHLYRCWETQGTVYAAMKNQRGSTLMAARPLMDRPPEEAWLRVLANHLLDALDTLHEAGVVHGGVSPRCIVLRRDGPTLLTEASDPMTPEEQAEAAAFLAPELRLGAEEMSVGTWTDVWCFAESLHFAITGDVHVDGQTTAEAVRKLRASFPQIRYSDKLLEAIDAGLAATPSRRPQTAAALRERLGLPTPVRRSAPVVPGQFETTPSPAVAPATGAPRPATVDPDATLPGAPTPFTEPPVLDDAVAGDADSVTAHERSAIDQALAGFGSVEARPLPAPAQGAHQPGAYEPIESPYSRLRMLGIGVALAGLLGVVGVVVWQVVDKHQADSVVKRATVGAPAESPSPAQRRRAPTGPEGRDLDIPVSGRP